MKEGKPYRLAGLSFVPTIILLTAACTTVNDLASYDLADSRIAIDMLEPPPPTVDVDYQMNFDKDNQFAAIVQLGANLVKAGEAEIARGKLERALSGTDIPWLISEQLLESVADTLEARIVDRKRDADLILELEILEYGIEARSSTGGVEMVMSLMASLFHAGAGETIWQRRISVSEEITPGLFGFNDVLGNAATIAGLNSLSEEQLAEGFERMAEEVAAKTVRKLQEDLREARRE